MVDVAKGLRATDRLRRRGRVVDAAIVEVLPRRFDDDPTVTATVRFLAADREVTAQVQVPAAAADGRWAASVAVRYDPLDTGNVVAVVGRWEQVRDALLAVFVIASSTLVVPAMVVTAIGYLIGWT
jgi:hypothetical protein